MTRAGIHLHAMPRDLRRRAAHRPGGITATVKDGIAGISDRLGTSAFGTEPGAASAPSESS
jgi:hypothetical protein